MSFDSIVGQDRAVAALRRALRADRVAHAYVFAGHPGVGKMTAALEFARALVCQDSSDDACGKCGPCGKVARGTHPDMHWIEPEGAGRQIKIGAFRDRETGEGLLKDLSLKPYEADRKIALIDDAHAMNLAAANCLLKTLEEPPPRSVLILVTPRPDALPETVLSRCHIIRFALLRPEVIQGQLEGRGIDTAAAQFLARSSGGSLGRALEMAEEAHLPELRQKVLQMLTGLAESNVIEQCSQFTAMVRELSESRAESRSIAEWLLDLAALFYRDVAVRQLGVDQTRLSNADVIELIDAESAISRLGIRAILDTIEETKGLLRSNVNIDAAALDAFSKIAARRSQRVARQRTPTKPGSGT